MQSVYSYAVAKTALTQVMAGFGCSKQSFETDIVRCGLRQRKVGSGHKIAYRFADILRVAIALQVHNFGMPAMKAKQVGMVSMLIDEPWLEVSRGGSVHGHKAPCPPRLYVGLFINKAVIARHLLAALDNIVNEAA